MKRLYYIAMLFCAVLVASCSKDPLDTPGIDSTTEGVVNLTLNLSAATRAEYTGDAEVRIYKVENNNRELVRHYMSMKNDMPAELRLIAGKYVAAVSIDKNTPATFDGGTLYSGEAEFDVEAGKVCNVNVECAIRNTLIKVVFDKSIEDTFKGYFEDTVTGLRGYYAAAVMASNEWDPNYKSSSKPHLEYERMDMTVNDEDGSSSRVGYFVLPAGVEHISYCFHGALEDKTVIGSNPDDDNNPVPGQVHIHNTKELKLYNDTTREGVMYTLTFKYTPDAEGYVKVDFDVTAADWAVTDKVAGIDPSPKPIVEGDGFSLGEIHNVAGQELAYTASYDKAAIEKITVRVSDVATRAAGDIVIDLKNSDYDQDGITATREEEGKKVKLTFGAGFLNKLNGGTHRLRFTIVAGDKENDLTSTIRTQGLVAVEHDAWNAAADAAAVVFADNKSNAKIQYREKGGNGSWTDYALAATTDGDIYDESISGFGYENRGKTYELQLAINGQQTGKIVEITTAAGTPEIPNAGFETWGSYQFPNDKKAILGPYTDNTDQFWDTGNHGSATLSKTVTTNDSDKPHGGSYSAKLQSQWIVMKFAAGNIFVGEYVDTVGTDGVIAFGKKFNYTYRPKALRFWYKANVGNIDRGSGAPNVSQGDLDPNEIYVMLCNMEGPHIVNTSDKGTLVDPKSPTIPYCSASSYNSKSTNDAKGNVVAYGVWNNTKSQSEWKDVDLELNFHEENKTQKPTYLMITASASKYGDYFMGCDKNSLSLDDIEFVY